MNKQVALDDLRLHPAAATVPEPDRTDLAALRASLKEYGQQDPIDATSDGIILDGRTRWRLLRELGNLSAIVRVVDIPEAQQVGYIVDRALSRRHLTLAQKQALNDLLRLQVIEERPAIKGGQPAGPPMRIGYSQTERAEKLGVDLGTVKNWDHVGEISPTSSIPTHAIDKRGRPQPLHKGTPKAERLPPAPKGPDEPWDMTRRRNQNIAAKAKSRVIHALGAMSGMASALLEVNYGNMRAACDPDELTAMAEQCVEITKALRLVRDRVRGAQ